MPNQAKLLGYLGLIPFMMIPLAIQFDILSSPVGFAFFSQYSAIILSFFGGVHWYAALTEKTNEHQLYVAMLPSVVGWLALISFADSRALGILSLAYVAILIYDKRYIRLHPNIIVDYTRFRIILTTIVVICHGVMIWQR